MDISFRHHPIFKEAVVCSEISYKPICQASLPLGKEYILLLQNDRLLHLLEKGRVDFKILAREKPSRNVKGIELCRNWFEPNRSAKTIG
jgi:hypothetical protein